jgi:hypothetical protein
MSRVDLFDTASTPQINLRQDGKSLPNGSGSGNFGAVKVRDAKSLVFTVENCGSAVLNVTGITLGAGETDQFILGLASMSSVVRSGEETAFIVTYAPTRTGTSGATVQIESDDPDERIYTFAISGTGKPVSLSVTQGATQLENGASSFAFDPVTSGYAGASVPFTLENQGEDPVTVSSIVLDTGDAADFQLAAPAMPYPLLQGESLGFTAAFAPLTGSSGQRSAEVLIASDAEAETSYRFDLLGTALAPVTDIAVEQGGTDYADGSAFSGFGNVTVGTSGQPVTFTIRNTGTGTLTLLGINSSNGAEFVAALTGTDFTLAPSQATAFAVTFRPSGTGTRVSVLEIASDDGDESPYTISLSGYGTPAPTPEINLKRGSTSVASGQQGYDYGSVLIGSASPAVTFTIENLGDLALTVSGISSSLPAFSLSAPSVPFSVPAASSSNFTLTFAPSIAGAVTGTVTIGNDDSNESPYTFTVRGAGQTPAPSIRVRRGSTDIPDGTAVGYDFGSVYTGAVSQYVTFTIDNTAGTAPLIISDLFCDGSEFAIDYTGFTSSVPTGGTTSFRMRFSPSSTGTKTTTVTISNNDPSAGRNPYTFTVSGTGTTPPNVVMSVWADGTKRPHESTVPFGLVDVGSDAAKTFTILNEGPENLVLNYIVKTDGNTVDFGVDITGTIVGQPISMNGSTTFTVTYAPSAEGPVWRNLEIGGNALQSPHVLRLEGNGSDD